MKKIIAILIIATISTNLFSQSYIKANFSINKLNDDLKYYFDKGNSLRVTYGYQLDKFEIENGLELNTFHHSNSYWNENTISDPTLLSVFRTVNPKSSVVPSYGEIGYFLGLNYRLLKYKFLSLKISALAKYAYHEKYYAYYIQTYSEEGNQTLIFLEERHTEKDFTFGYQGAVLLSACIIPNRVSIESSYSYSNTNNTSFGLKNAPINFTAINFGIKWQFLTDKN
jgi:hypothetical protein